MHQSTIIEIHAYFRRFFQKIWVYTRKNPIYTHLPSNMLLPLSILYLSNFRFNTFRLYIMCLILICWLCSFRSTVEFVLIALLFLLFLLLFIHNYHPRNSMYRKEFFMTFYHNTKKYLLHKIRHVILLFVSS